MDCSLYSWGGTCKNRALDDKADFFFVIVRYMDGDYKTDWKQSGRDLFLPFFHENPRWPPY